MKNNVQIPESLFFDLCEYFLWGGRFDDETKPVLIHDISIELRVKIEKLINQKLFTEYKTANTPEEREKARQKYLDERGIFLNYRSQKESRQ